MAKPVTPLPQATKTKPYRYDFTDVQLETLMPVLKEYQQIQNQINFFLSHVKQIGRASCRERV